MKNLSITQKAFNNVQRNLDELKQIKELSFVVIDTIIALENKLSEIAKELTAERYANEY